MRWLLTGDINSFAKTVAKKKKPGGMAARLRKATEESQKRN